MNDSLSRVEKQFIFNFLKTNKVKIEIKTPKGGTEAFIKEINNEEMLLELDSIPEDFSVYRLSFTGFFYFQDNYHIFNSIVVKAQGKTAIIKNPDNLARNLKRKHERTVVDGKYTAILKVPGPLLPLDYPKSEKYSYTEESPLNADFSDIKIQDILTRFKGKMGNFVTFNKIQMLRNYQPASFLEKLAIKTGKIVFIPNTKSDLTITHPEEKERLEICSKQDWKDFEHELNGTSEIQMNKTISNYMLEIKNQNVHSIAVVPVIYRNYIVALITLKNDLTYGKIIPYSILKYAEQFARILSFSLKEGGYFKTEIGAPIEFQLPVFDISPGGISVISDDSILENKLQVNQNFGLEIEIEGNKIKTTAKLVRIKEKLLNKFYGFMFIDIKEKDFEFLEYYFSSSATDETTA